MFNMDIPLKAYGLINFDTVADNLGKLQDNLSKTEKCHTSVLWWTSIVCFSMEHMLTPQRTLINKYYQGIMHSYYSHLTHRGALEFVRGQNPNDSCHCIIEYCGYCSNISVRQINCTG